MFSDITVHVPEGIAEGPTAAHPTIRRAKLLCQRLHRMLHEAMGDTPSSFRHTIQKRGRTPLLLDWTPVALTAGVARWIRKRKVVAASILLNGVEDLGDSSDIREFFERENLVVPGAVWEEMWATRERPLVTTLYYTPSGKADETVAATCNTLAMAYFGIFGTIDE